MWTKGLNLEQAEAVRHDRGPLLILAGAGSGKTTVLVSRTGRLIDEDIAKPSEICVLTFTNKSARELKERVARKISVTGLWTGTFHSFGLGILRQHAKAAGLPTHFGILDQSDAQGVVRELMRDLVVAGRDKFDLSKVLELINEFRVRGRFANQVSDEYHEVAEVLAPRYARKLSLLGGVDFEGLLLKPLELFREHPNIQEAVRSRYTQIMVDEFQDTNPLQMELIEALLGPHQNISVVGDDDQSIYGWRGAEVKNILDFPKRFKECKVIRLERNYRSSPQILELANSVIQNNKSRFGKTLRTDVGASVGLSADHLPEVFVHETEDDESQFISREIRGFFDQGFKPNDVAVLYRSNTQGALLESYLRENRIPYRISGGTGLFDRKEIKDVLAYLKLMFAPSDLSLRRVINTPNRGVGDATVEKIHQLSLVEKLPFLVAARKYTDLHPGDKAAVAIKDFLAKIARARGSILGSKQPSQELTQFLKDLSYRDYLFHGSSTAETADKRWAVMEIFFRIVDRFTDADGLTESGVRNFIDAMELRDEPESETKDPQVHLLTLHASKGLEFPVVFLIGVEEDLLPHRSLGSNVDEERRLFYVGITRAKQKLILSRCRTRQRYGAQRPVSPSRFLLEISGELVREFPDGARPVSGLQREALVADFLAKLGSAREK